MNAPFVASLTLEVSLLLFHVIVVACLTQRRRKGDPVFCSDFFTFYLLQSYADIVEYVLMLVHIRLPRIGYTLTPTYSYFAGSVVPFLLVYGMYLQALVHAAIAVNRYVVLSSQTFTNASDSSKKRTRLVVALLTLLPVPGAGLRLLGNSKLYALMQFVGQLAVAVYFCVMTYAAFVEDHTLVAVAQSMNGVLCDYFCLSAPICLFSTSKLLRRAYEEMYGAWLSCLVSSSNGAMAVDDTPTSAFA